MNGLRLPLGYTVALLLVLFALLLGGSWLTQVPLLPQHGITEESIAGRSILRFVSVPLAIAWLPVVMGIGILARAKLLRRRMEEALADRPSGTPPEKDEAVPSRPLRRAGRPLAILAIAACSALLASNVVGTIEVTSTEARLPESSFVMLLASFGKGVGIWVTLVIGLGAVLLLLIDTELVRMDRTIGRRPPAFSDRYHS